MPLGFIRVKFPASPETDQILIINALPFLDQVLDT